MADGTGVFQTFSFILRGSFSRWPTFNCVSFTENFCLQSQCQGHYLIFFILGSLSALSFPLSCCILIRESSSSLCVLAAASCRSCWSFLSWSSNLQPVFLLPPHTRSVSPSRFQRCSALLLRLHWSESPPLSWFQCSAIIYFSDVNCAPRLVMSSSGHEGKKNQSFNYFAGTSLCSRYEPFVMSQRAQEPMSD